jgi:hypothetical protein
MLCIVPLLYCLCTADLFKRCPKLMYRALTLHNSLYCLPLCIMPSLYCLVQQTCSSAALS